MKNGSFNRIRFFFFSFRHLHWTLENFVAQTKKVVLNLKSRRGLLTNFLFIKIFFIGFVWDFELRIFIIVKNKVNDLQ